MTILNVRTQTYGHTDIQNTALQHTGGMLTRVDPVVQTVQTIQTVQTSWPSIMAFAGEGYIWAYIKAYINVTRTTRACPPVSPASKERK